mgnify:CR=1 FL=1
MKKMFIKVFMNDACGETHDIHEDDVREIEIKIKEDEIAEKEASKQIKLK